MHRVGKMGVILLAHSQLRWDKVMLFLFVSAHTVESCPLWGSICVTFCILCFFLILLFKIAPRNSPGVLSGVHEPEKAGMGPLEKTHVWDELPSGMSYSVAGHDEFSVHNESQCVLNNGSLNRNTHKRRIYTDRLTEMWAEAGKNKTLYLL